MEQWLARSTSDLLIVGSNPSQAMFFLFFSPQDETKSESWPVQILVSALPGFWANF